MAQDKKFRHKPSRPSLAASLEAVRQGRTLETTATPEPQSIERTEPVPSNRPAASTQEATFVRAEIRRIGLIMGALLVLLVVLAILEQRSGLLTRFAQTLLSQ